MRVQHYRALLEPDSKGGYGVVFPDFPRCVSVGADAETAVHQAAEALALHIEGMLEDETTLPSPSAPDAPLPGWLADEPGTGRWVRVLVPVTVPARPAASTSPSRRACSPASTMPPETTA
jgi:predicted RNase H-like HicB family nuclease